VKTRLHAAFTPCEAARLAEASLRDTLAAVRATPIERRILALDGPTGPWLGDGFEVIPQVLGPLGQRLEGAWTHTDGAGLQIGMDTPQVTPRQLEAAMERLLEPTTDAVLGLATDGGWWAIGLREPVTGAFDGVPMSRADTGRRQLERLRELGLRTELLPTLRDMDHPADVEAICRAHPHLRTATVATAIRSEAVA
jgi:uncharacterized protein